jgi:hypothetical protein
MDTEILVTFPLQDGKRLIERLEDEGFDIRADYWGYFPEPDEWRLVIAMPDVDKIGPTKIYLQIIPILSSMEPPLHFGLDQIMLVSSNKRTIKALQRAYHVRRGEPGIRLKHSSVIGENVEEAYLYRA